MPSDSLGNIGARRTRKAVPLSTNEVELSEGGRISLYRPIILGGMDGLITSFAVLISAIAGEVDAGSALLIGVASLLADGLSMGFSEFLSTRRDDVRLGVSALLGAACFISFTLLGSVPLIAFALSENKEVAVVVSYSVGVASVSVARAFESKSKGRAVLETVILASGAGLASYLVAKIVKSLEEE